MPVAENRLTIFPGKGYHPFHILFARMGITVLCSSLYMWYKKTENFPFGLKEVRSLLVARGLFGFFGVFGMYCKLNPCRLHSRLLAVVGICKRIARVIGASQQVTT